jgi:glycosyltransferase involved in cell wall biosynthesis
LRLLVVSQYFWPETFRINDLVAELVARGHRVTVLTGLPNYPEGRVFDAYRREPGAYTSFAGADVVRVPLMPRGSGSVRLALNYLSFVASALVFGPWRLRGRPFDAIFVFQTSPVTAALPALLLRRVKRAPLLMWVLDLWPDTLSAIGAVRSPALLDAVGRLVAFIYRRCDRILVQSRSFLANVQRYGGDMTRVRYFPGWAEPIFQGGLEGVEPAPETAAYRDGSFNVLFAGNLGDAQDFPAILDAAEALRARRDIRWLILGDGRAAPMLRAEIDRRGLQASVVLLGRHPLERMPSFFRAADDLLVTLKRDPNFALTIPGKVQSYLAAGLPLLAMLDGEGARVIEEAGAGLVAPAGEGRALAAQVERLASLSPAERAAMGARARECCERDFDRASLITALESWIDEVAPRSDAPAATTARG